MRYLLCLLLVGCAVEAPHSPVHGRTFHIPSYMLEGVRPRVSASGGSSSGASLTAIQTFTGANTFSAMTVFSNAVGIQLATGSYLSLDSGNTLTLRNASGSLELGGMIISAGDNTSDFGNASHRFRNIYAGTGIYMGAGNLALSGTAPTLSGFGGTGATVSNSNGSVAFEINVGTVAPGNTGTINFPTATVGWVCRCYNKTTTSSVNEIIVTSDTASTCVIAQQVIATGSAANFAASDKIRCTATAL